MPRKQRIHPLATLISECNVHGFQFKYAQPNSNVLLALQMVGAWMNDHLPWIDQPSLDEYFKIRPETLVAFAIRVHALQSESENVDVENFARICIATLLDFTYTLALIMSDQDEQIEMLEAMIEILRSAYVWTTAEEIREIIDGIKSMGRGKLWNFRYFINTIYKRYLSDLDEIEASNEEEACGGDEK